MGAVPKTMLPNSSCRGYPLTIGGNSHAEVDFVLQKESNNRIEVKIGRHVRSRSIAVFRSAYHPLIPFALSEKFRRRRWTEIDPINAASASRDDVF
jgi:hypothetical protein